MRLPPLTALLLAAGLLAPAAIAAAAEALAADRPDLAEGPEPVEPRAVQLEAGWTHHRLGGSAAGALVQDGVGEWLVRVGIAPGWEARFEPPSWYRETLAEPGAPAGRSERRAIAGAGDVGLGLKRALPSPGARVELGLLATVGLPVGREPFGGGPVGGDLVLAAALETAPVDACANVGFGRAGGENSALATVALERGVARAVSTFAEVAWLTEGARASSLAGLGLLWRASPAMQFDVRAGATFRRSEARALYGLGMAHRW